MKYGAGRTTVPHSERCRQRIMEEMAKSDVGQQRISEATERLDRAVADVGQQYRADIQQQPAAQGETGGSSVRAQVDVDSSANPFKISDVPIVADEPVVCDERADGAEAQGSEELVEAEGGMEFDVAEVVKVDCTVPLTDASGEPASFCLLYTSDAADE